GLDDAVEPFRGGIADPVPEPAQDVLQPLVDHLRYLLDGLEPATAGPTEPGPEELVRFFRIPAVPEPAELFPDRPGPGGLQLGILELLELRPFLVTEVLQVV